MSRQTPSDSALDRWKNYTRKMNLQHAWYKDISDGSEEYVTIRVLSCIETLLYVRYFANVAENAMRTLFTEYDWENMPEQRFERAIREICDMEVNEFDAASQVCDRMELIRRAQAYHEKFGKHFEHVCKQILSRIKWTPKDATDPDAVAFCEKKNAENANNEKQWIP